MENNPNPKGRIDVAIQLNATEPRPMAIRLTADDYAFLQSIAFRIQISAEEMIEKSTQDLIDSYRQTIADIEPFMTTSDIDQYLRMDLKRIYRTQYRPNV